MTAWPWMKSDPSLSVADPPIAPICDADERPAVSDLIDKHRLEIDELASDLALGAESKRLFDTNKHDDLWLLRFVLSHKGHHKPALEAAVKTLQFRAENELDLKDIRQYPPGPLALEEPVKKYFDCVKDGRFAFDVPDQKRGVIVFLPLVQFDQKQLIKLDFADRLKAFCYINEWTHQWLDYITRTTGRLTKSARLLDCKGVGLRHINYELFHIEAKAIATMQDYYPQLLESFYLCDPPSWVHVPWKIMRPLLPSRLVHKIDFVAPGKSKKERKRLHAHLQEEHLPVQYGGQRVF